MVKKHLVFIAYLLCSVLLCGCVSVTPSPSEVWHSEILGKTASLTLYTDNTCLMEISVESYDYRGTWKREDGFLVLTLTAVHKEEGYRIAVGDMYFEEFPNELVCLMDGADEALIFRRQAQDAPEATPSAPER